MLAQAADENGEELLKLSCSRTFVDLFHCAGKVNEEDVEVVLVYDYVVDDSAAGIPDELEVMKKTQDGDEPVE